MCIRDSSLTILIKLIDNEVTNKAYNLRKDTHTLETIINPTKDDLDAEPLTIEVIFKILGVRQNGWPLFQDNINKPLDDEIREIKDVIRANIKQNLEAIPYEVLRQKDKKILLEVDGVVDLALNDSGKNFGLTIGRMSSILIHSADENERAASAISRIEKREKSFRKRNKKLLKHKETELDFILALEKENLDAGLMDEEDLGKKIEELTKDSTKKYEKSERKKALKKGKSKPFSFEDEFGSTPSLNEGNSEKDKQ